MSITSLSFNFVNLYAPPVARPAAASERQAAPAATQDKCCAAPRPGGPENRLVHAMLSAFRELGFGGAPASGSTTAVTANASAAAPSPQASVAEGVTTQATSATAATAESAANAANAASAAQRDASAAASSTQPTPTPAPTVESAVQQFAHELFRALREGGRGDASEQPASRVDGERGHRRHHGHHGHPGHHGMRGHGYGDMSQRLQTLSQTFGATAPAPATATPEAQPSAVAAKEFSITLPLTDGQVDAPGPAPARAVSPPTAGVATEATAATDVPKSSAVNPLLEAFSKLFTALKPHSAALPETGMADKLRLFLQTLAQALRPEAMHSLQTPQVGGLVNVVA